MCIRILFFFFLFPFLINAELKMASLFKDGAVLQRDMAIPVWGWGDAGTKVTVSINGNSVETSVDEKGAWSVNLPEMVAGGPFEMSVSHGSAKLALKDILVGEVWICSGQSNMDMGHGGIPEFKTIIAEAAKLPIRSFMVEKFVAFEKQNKYDQAAG